MTKVTTDNTPIDFQKVSNALDKAKIPSLAKASIRELVALVNTIESGTGEKYIRMEMGVPGLPAPSIGIEGEIKALESGVASKYPMLEGIPQLKQEISRFCWLFSHCRCGTRRTSLFPSR